MKPEYLEEIVKSQTSYFVSDFYDYDLKKDSYSNFFDYIQQELDSEKFEYGLRMLVKYMELKTNK